MSGFALFGPAEGRRLDRVRRNTHSPGHEAGKRLRGAALAILATAVSATAVVAAASSVFELTCAGSEAFHDGRAWGQRPFSLKIRIDLKRRVYCLTECSRLEPIASMSSDILVLRDVVESGLHHNRLALVRHGEGYLIPHLEDAQNIARDGACRIEPLMGPLHPDR